MATVTTEEFNPAPVVPLASQTPARLIVDAPLPESLVLGRVTVRYRTENLRIVPVFGPAALDVSPRIGHLHVTIDAAAWHWVDASGDPLIIVGLAAGRTRCSSSSPTRTTRSWTARASISKSRTGRCLTIDGAWRAALAPSLAAWQLPGRVLVRRLMFI